MTACNSETDAPGATVYRHALDGTPTTLDPAQASTIYTNFLTVALYDTLYSYQYLARPYRLKPNLATAMPEISADRLTYTIKIKPGVHFIDDNAFPDGRGREVTAADFVYSIKRHFDDKSRARGAWLWQGRIVGLDQWKTDGADYATAVEGLRAIDKYTIQIRLTKPYPQLTHTLAQGYSAIVAREAVEYYGREFTLRPVGSGPFMLNSFTSAKAVLVANPNYRREPINLQQEGYDPENQAHFGLAGIAGLTPPLVDRVEIQFIPEDAARWNALTSGKQVDFIRVPSTQFENILASRDPIQSKPDIAEKYHMLAPLEAGFVRIDFNLADPNIGYHPDAEQNRRNHALRCAIRYAVDWEARNESFYYGIGEVFPGVIPPITPEYDASISRDSVTRNIPAAKQLLQDHGWTPSNLPVLEYGFSANVTQRQMYEQMRGFLADIGYPPEKIKAQTYATFGDFTKAYLQRKIMLVPSGWNMDYPDAENTIQLYYGPNQTPGSNIANFQNAQFDQLYQASSSLPPSAERTELYQQMNQLVIDSCATISGLSRTMVFLWDKDIIMMPDRSFVGGYFLKYVDIQTED